MCSKIIQIIKEKKGFGLFFSLQFDVCNIHIICWALSGLEVVHGFFWAKYVPRD